MGDKSNPQEHPGWQAWLMLAVGSDRQHGGNDGYDDRPSTHYSWDETVPNHAAVQVGDAVVLWDKHSLLGASVVESIEQRRISKKLYSCPSCELAGIKARKTVRPRFKCYKCGATFDKPRTRSQRVTTYRSQHDVAWIDLSGCLSGPELRSLCEHPSSQLSIRHLDWQRFSDAIAQHDPTLRLTLMGSRTDRIVGGHRSSTVRVRVGQAAFRNRLLETFGEVCALTGPAPAPTLEAGHLYSFAELDEHHSHGGLMLRRDVHRLFDLGELAVDPTSLRIDVGKALMEFPTYSSLQGAPLQVPLDGGHRKWLAEHWLMYR
jgi:hypothetical protein